MYMCIYDCIYIHMYKYIYVCICIYTHAHTRIQKYQRETQLPSNIPKFGVEMIDVKSVCIRKSESWFVVEGLQFRV